MLEFQLEDLPQIPVPIQQEIPVKFSSKPSASSEHSKDLFTVPSIAKLFYRDRHSASGSLPPCYNWNNYSQKNPLKVYKQTL